MYNCQSTIPKDPGREEIRGTNAEASGYKGQGQLIHAERKDCGENGYTG